MYLINIKFIANVKYEIYMRANLIHSQIVVRYFNNIINYIII